MDLKHSLAPLTCPEPRILILGSLPSDESLRRQEYYGNPRNMFWSVLAAIFDDTVPENYPEKKTFLARHHVALWDVFASAERVGSLDANIREIACNDIPAFLKEHPTIEAIALNGGKATKAFKKLQKQYRDGFGEVRVYSFTSTSPLSISAGWPLDRIVEQWKQILTVYEEI